MAQIHNEHLTTEQLSASFDKQLSPQEQAVFDAHISTCQHCQNKLADLRLTAALLHALPEEEAPRSFVLPGNVSIIPDRNIQRDATFTPVLQKQRKQVSLLRRSIRVVSTLAAVLALCFIISGILPLLYSGGTGTSTTASSGSTPLEMGKAHPTVTVPGVQEQNRVSPSVGSASTTPPTETAHSLSPSDKGTATSKTEHPANPGPTTPPAIDLSQPVTRLGLGVIVLAVSIIILIVTRRGRVAVH